MTIITRLTYYMQVYYIIEHLQITYNYLSGLSPKRGSAALLSQRRADKMQKKISP